MNSVNKKINDRERIMNPETLPHTCRCGARWSGQSAPSAIWATPWSDVPARLVPHSTPGLIRGSGERNEEIYEGNRS